MKNTKTILIGGVLVALLVAVLVGATSAYAQGSSDPLSHGNGPGGGRRGFGSLAGLQAAAQALGMTTDELITALRSGQTLEQIAEAEGVDFADVEAAIQEARETEFRERIQQAVDAGTITQTHADWLLEGLEQGFIGGSGRGFHFGGMPGPGTSPAPTTQPTPTGSG
jgi:hypothetical protein